MKPRRKLFACVVLAALCLSLAPAPAVASDRSFSSVVKHIKKNYNAKQQGFFGMMGLARFLVKVMKPAGVKNFKVAMLRDVDFTRFPGETAFSQSIDDLVDPSWRPIIHFRARRNPQFTHVYVQEEKKDIKFLVITMQQREAFVVQFKFSPERLAEFMNNPQILGINLKD